MVRRRDSMSYSEFLRGKYDPEDTAYVTRLFEHMTVRERERIVSIPFDDLWTRLWGSQDRKGNDYKISKEKFGLLDLPTFLANSTSTYEEPEWGFPKGRRVRCETDQACAEREFWEETNIEKDRYVILQNITFQEQFLGTNGIPYSHRYMVAILQNPVDIHRRFTNAQAREISAVAWKSISECLAVTRPHYTGRIGMIEAFVKFLGSIEFEKNRR
jgi:8-oxo-dGTP pyrophosphatase MutT (NUDIX family)